jgi:hypothetical protein
MHLLDQTTADRQQHARQRGIDQSIGAEVIHQRSAGPVVVQGTIDDILLLAWISKQRRVPHRASAGLSVPSKRGVNSVPVFVPLARTGLY